MDQKHYSDLIDRFFAGQTSLEENRLLRILFGEKPDEYFEKYSRDKWENALKAGSVSNSLTDTDKSKMKTEILSKVKGERRRHILSCVKTVSVAAAIVVAAVLGYHSATWTAPVQTFEIIAGRGQKSMATLPDGTKVWLNSGTRIAYDSEYNRRNRDIDLEGEAFFEVAKNEKIPFDVKADDMTIRALGTKFNVKAYEEDKRVCAILLEGKIKTTVAGEEMVLEPWEKAVLDRKTGVFSKKEVTNKLNAVPWRKDVIMFEGETLTQVAAMLERMYNVEVVLSDGLSDYSYTGLISNNSLRNVLNLISGTSPVDYCIHGNVVKFSARK